MGNQVSFDAEPLSLDDLIAYRPSASTVLPPLKFRSNIKAWRFYATDAPLQVRHAPLKPGFSTFEPTECYVVLHIYRRKEEVPSAGTVSADAASAHAPASPASSVQSVSGLASASKECLSPRGISGPFSGYDDCGAPRSRYLHMERAERAGAHQSGRADPMLRARADTHER
jgi:hypothetical protein